MLQCKECEYFQRDEKTGRIMLRCDPFSTIKEPACLEKMQLLRLDGLLQMYQGMLRWYQKMAPMQEKMFDFMNREMGDIDEGDSWKYSDQDEEDKKDEEEPTGDEDEFKF